MSRERGSGTVALVGVVGAVLLLTWGGLALGSAVVATHRARAAADLAALAGAVALGRGSDAPDACASSADVAARNGATLVHCRPGPDGSVVVGTSVAVPLVVHGTGSKATATSRAGPAP